MDNQNDRPKAISSPGPVFFRPEAKKGGTTSVAATWVAATLKVLAVLLLAFLATLFTVRIALAQQGSIVVTDDQVNRVASQLYCPVCENIPLDVCPTTACAQWRALIKEKLEAGWTDQQIKDYFVQQYGARVLGTPPAKGLNWLAYVIPPLAILAGVYVLYRVLRSWRQPLSPSTTTTALPDAPPSDEYIRRLEEELKSK